VIGELAPADIVPTREPRRSTVIRFVMVDSGTDCVTTTRRSVVSLVLRKPHRIFSDVLTQGTISTNRLVAMHMAAPSSENDDPIEGIG
jgi:hypothetical protein